MLRSVVLKTYAMLFSSLFAIIFVAQILGFLSLYRPLIAIPATILVAVLAYWGYQKFSLEIPSKDLQSKTLQNSLVIASLILVFCVFLVRMLLWPHSELGKNISGDFFGYHGLKVLELARSGSIWNLAIPYGDYPNGYESLASFGLLLIGDIRVLGFFHALIFVLFWLTVALLFMRYAAMPLPWALFVSALLAFFPLFYSLLLSIGKNDVLLTLTILTAILHAPIPSRQFHPLGLTYSTMMSLAVKASGLYILFFLWALVMLYWFLAWREGKTKAYFHPAVFLLSVAIMFAGGLWVIRNYLLLGEVLTAEVRSFFITSIGANLTNPLLYNSETETWMLLGALAIVLVMAAISYKLASRSMSLLLLVMALTFVFTPLSAFHTLQSEVLHVEWRYVLHGSVLIAILFLALLWKFFGAKIQEQTLFASLSLIMSIALILLLNPLELFAYDASRAEQFLDPHGAAPTVYDEVARLESGIVYLDWGNWFVLAYANPNITITQGTLYPLGRGDIYPAPVPDYAFFIPRAHDPEPNFDNLGAIYDWELIYSDETGNLYRRLP
jgi:hypothetical protein